jgi:hypothetical protein
MGAGLSSHGLYLSAGPRFLTQPLCKPEELQKKCIYAAKTARFDSGLWEDAETTPVSDGRIWVNLFPQRAQALNADAYGNILYFDQGVFTTDTLERTVEGRLDRIVGAIKGFVRFVRNLNESLGWRSIMDFHLTCRGTRNVQLRYSNILIKHAASLYDDQVEATAEMPLPSDDHMLQVMHTLYRELQWNWGVNTLYSIDDAPVS